MQIGAHCDDSALLYVDFEAECCDPIDQGQWPKDHWRSALRAPSIRPRKFYATRHAFISVALTAGLNLKFLAEYCGTSVAMIERDYGRSLEGQVEAQLRLVATADQGQEEARTLAAARAKPSTMPAGLTVLAKKPFESKASLAVPSWNQILTWLREMDLLRQAQAA